MGSVWVPAWVCGLAWFAKEVLDLASGGAPGVATGAHVGGFVVGGLVALGMRGLGFEKELLTVAEAQALQQEYDGHMGDAQVAMARSDWEVAREQLLTLQRKSPEYPGLASMLAEVDVRSRRGLVRLERVLRGLLAKRGNRELEALVTRLWPAIDAKEFTPAFAWALAERLRGLRPPVDPQIVQALLEAVAQGTGALAIKARGLMAQPAPVETPRRMLIEVGSISALTPEGLRVVVAGAVRFLPWSVIRGVFAAVITEPGGRGVLWVDVAFVVDGRVEVVRLKGSDPAVPPLFPGRDVPSAWREFIAGVRRACGVQQGEPEWVQLGSLGELEKLSVQVGSG
jgi:hypothetical protein